MNFAFDTNTKLNIILAILAIILVLAMILVFRKTGESYASCGGKSESYAFSYGSSDHEGYASCGEGYAVTCSNAACNDNMCAICKANQNKPDYYEGKDGCSVCGL